MRYWQNEETGIVCESECRPSKRHFDCTVMVLRERVGELEAAITKTLNDNGNLSDGENCKLIDLKRVMPTGSWSNPISNLNSPSVAAVG